ncbi:MAG: hypothetical protein ACK5ZS_00130 [bacterium]
MPTVRLYGQQQQELRAVPGARLTAAPTAETLGADAGAKIANVGLNLYQDELLRQDQVATLEADRKLSEWELRTMYDPRQGALAKRGKDAMGLPDTVSADYDKFTGELRNSLANDRQRVAFDRMVESRRKDINTSLSRHVFTEVRKFDDQETENYLKNSREAAIANFGDPARITTEIERQTAAVMDFANRNGLGPEYTKQKITLIRSDTHEGVITRMLANGMDQGAKAYYDRVKGELTGDTAAKVEKVLTVAITEGAGLRGAGEIWAAMGPKADADPVSLDRMRDEAEKRYGSDPKVYRAVMDQLKERASLHNGAQRERAEGNEARVWDARNSGASLSTVMRMPEYLALPGEKREQIKNSIIDRGYMLEGRARAEKERRGWSTYWEYDNAAKLASMTEDQIKNLSSRMSPQQVNSLLVKKRSLSKSDDTVRSATIDDDQFKALAESAGLKPFDKKSDKAALGRLKNTVETLIDEEQRTTGRPLTRERKGQIMQQAIDQKVMLDEWGRDPEMPAGMVPQDQRGSAYVPINRIDGTVVSEYLNYLRSASAVPMGMSDAVASARFKDRIQRAYGARLTGASREEIENILRGR